MNRRTSRLFVASACPHCPGDWRQRPLLVRRSLNPGPRATGDDCDDSSGLEEATEIAEEEVGGQETGPKAEESFRLIERFFPSEAVSERSYRERYQRGKTPHTIFTWWARRPFAAASAVVTTSLIESTGLEERALELVDQYCRSDEPGLLGFALESLTAASRQRVLDLFGGGATIPIEAARHGAMTYAVDNNELAHFIQTALLQLSQGQPELEKDVERCGTELLEELRTATDSFFPKRYAGDAGRTIAYLWSREVQCPECDGWLSLMKRPWLARRGDRKMFVERKPIPSQAEYTVEIRKSGEPGDDQSAWRANQIECPFCDHVIARDAINEVMEQRARDRLVAACTSRGRSARGRKEYVRARWSEHHPGRGHLEAAITSDLNAMGETLPTAALPRWSGVTNPALYGMARHVDLFNLRQRAVLVRFCRLLREHHTRWTRQMGTDRAAVVAAFLSGLVDQLVDWNGRLATWISQNEQVGRGLSGPGMAMIWDHVEIDPVEEAPANLWDKLDRIVQGIRAIPELDQKPEVLRADARDLPFDDGIFDVVATDPPYFDNIFYSVLADCIYVWKRLALSEIFPDYFAAKCTDESRELTMNRHAHADSSGATEYYRSGMEEVFREVHRVLKPGGILSLIFAHSKVEAWASIVSAMRRARLEVVAAWPMYVERQHRPRGMSSRAINTSFVLVARRRRGEREQLSLQRFQAELEQRLRSEDKTLELDDKYGPDTRGRTLFGMGISYYSQAGSIFDDQNRELSAEEVVEEIANAVEKIVGADAWGVRRR